MLNSQFIEGQTLLHKIPVKPKLMGLMVISLGLYLVDHLTLMLAVLLAASGIYLSLGMRWPEAMARLRPALFTIVLLALFNFFFLPPLEVILMAVRLTTVVLIALSITATTGIAEFIDAITDFARPLEKLGWIRASDIGLAIGLVLRFVPEIAARYEALKEAHAARGIPMKLHRMLGPLIILTLKDADRIAEAIDARRVRGQ